MTDRDHVDIVCLNRDCRHYQIFSLGIRLGEKPELDRDGDLEPDEHDAVVAGYMSRTV